MAHLAVLCKEVIAGLAVKPDGVYIDATFGRGGHAAFLLEHLSPAGRLYALDKDWAAVDYAAARFALDKRFHIVQGSFAQLATLAKQWDIVGRVSGVMLDLGVSSPQLDDATRGFSFMHSGPLDMRMDQRQTMNAAIFVNQADETVLADVFFQFGEERFARRIARAIVQARAHQPITDTAELAAIIKDAHPQWDQHKHPATRVFQAIRIYVNQELADLDAALTQSLTILAPQGRLAVISFHSLEDRLVKQFMRQQECGIPLPKHIPLKSSPMGTGFKRIGKAIKPSLTEIQNNRRARSAILRIGEKQA